MLQIITLLGEGNYAKALLSSHSNTKKSITTGCLPMIQFHMIARFYKNKTLY